jgi:hypothetical protein
MANNKVKSDAQPLSSHEVNSPSETRTALETNHEGNPLGQFPKGGKIQTSDEALEEARRRGCYKVLPPVLGPHEKVRTVDELLKDIDEEVRQALIL